MWGVCVCVCVRERERERQRERQRERMPELTNTHGWLNKMKRLFENVTGLPRPKACHGWLGQRTFSGQLEPVAVWTGPGDKWRPGLTIRDNVKEKECVQRQVAGDYLLIRISCFIC